MGLARLEVLFFFVIVQELFVLRQISASPVLLLMQVAPEVYHLRLQKRQYGLDEQEVYHLRLRPVLVCELDIGADVCVSVQFESSPFWPNSNMAQSFTERRSQEKILVPSGPKML